MKKIYRKPYKVSDQSLLFITVLSIIIFYFVQWRQPLVYTNSMQQAISLTEHGINIIKKEKQRLGIMTRELEDPMQTGMIGSWKTTPVTSVLGHLDSKQASVNPKFAALIYRWLKESGVEQGDYVAISASGSFPALNLATYSALQILGAKSLLILSLTASQWGANQPELMWIDMARILKEQGLFDITPLAVSYGAAEDNAQNISDQGILLLNQAIKRNGQPELIYTGSLMRNIEKKWTIYKNNANKKPIKAFINIGGGKSSVGSNNDKKILFKPGLNTELSSDSKAEIAALMWRFIDSGTPVIHLSNIKNIIATNKLNDNHTYELYKDSNSQQFFSTLGIIILIASLIIASILYRKNEKIQSI